MIFSDRSKVFKNWHKLVRKFFEERMYGNIQAVNSILESMYDFILENQRNFPRETFSRAESIIEEVFFFLNADQTRRRRNIACNFQIAIRCIHGRNFFYQLLD